MRDLTLDDFQRLSIEIGATTTDVGEWAERVGLDPDLLQDIGRVGSHMVFRLLMGAAAKQFEDEIPENLEDREITDVEIGDLITQACVSAFVLGFETNKQFGRLLSDDEQG